MAEVTLHFRADRLPRWLVEWIDQQDGTRADVIEAALLKAHKLRAPKD